MTREEFESVLFEFGTSDYGRVMIYAGYASEWFALLEHDAAQRARISELETKVAELQEVVDSVSDVKMDEDLIS